MATHRDIARLAGCTPGTVSDILNERPGKSYAAKTCERVRLAAAKLGYTPNRLARGLIKGQTKAVGIVVPDIANPLYVSILKDLSEILRPAGYSLIIEEAPVAESGEAEIKVLSDLAGFRVDAIIGSFVHARTYETFLQGQADRGTAILVLGSKPPPGLEADCVLMDYRDGLRAAVGELVAAGFRRFAYFGFLPWLKRPGWRFDLIREAVEAEGLDPDLVSAHACEQNPEGAVRAFLEQFGNPPAAGDGTRTAVFSVDHFAIAVTRAALQAGWRIPQDLAIVGLDNTPLGAQVPVPISAVWPDLHRGVSTAAQVLLARLAAGRPPPEPTSLVLEARYHRRSTTP